MVLCACLMWGQDGATPMHWAAERGHILVLEVLCEHAPAMLEAKTNVRIGVFVYILPHVSAVGMQSGYTPLHFAASQSHTSAVNWIVDRVPYQVPERDDHGT
jgi:ankyrin repeat protein